MDLVVRAPSITNVLAVCIGWVQYIPIAKLSKRPTVVFGTDDDHLNVTVNNRSP